MFQLFILLTNLIINKAIFGIIRYYKEGASYNREKVDTMFSVESYTASLRDHLNNSTPILMEKLKEINTFTFAETVELVDFLTFTDPMRFELSIMMFSMDTDANEVFGDDVSVDHFAGSLEVLKDIPYYELPESQQEQFWAFYEHHDETLSLKEQELFAQWFATCWLEAGGKKFALPAYFSSHDASLSYDLQNHKFIDCEEKWA